MQCIGVMNIVGNYVLCNCQQNIVQADNATTVMTSAHMTEFNQWFSTCYKMNIPSESGKLYGTHHLGGTRLLGRENFEGWRDALSCIYGEGSSYQRIRQWRPGHLFNFPNLQKSQQSNVGCQVGRAPQVQKRKEHTTSLHQTPGLSSCEHVSHIVHETIMTTLD